MVEGAMSGWKSENVMGGCKKPLQALRQLLIWPHLYYEEAALLGLKWPRGLLLHGPPGTGKTSLVQAIVREYGAHLTAISAGTVHRAYAGESERLLREAFAEASSHALSGKPAVVFIDEIDALCPRRNSKHQYESRLVAQLLTLMDGIKQDSAKTGVKPCGVVVIAATNRINAIDPALRRPGRFDREIEVTVPNYTERFEILQLLAQHLPLDETVDLQSVAAICNGYVGADLATLCREAAMGALRRNLHDRKEGDMQKLSMEDWLQAHVNVGPSVVRGAVVEVPKVLWEDIGGLHDVKRKLHRAVEWPIRYAAAFTRLGLQPARGVLLHGPPGCCKTNLAKAAAHAAQANLLSLSGAELYSMYVGEGEALLRATFSRARLAAPSIIFFDEIDAIAPKRGSSNQNAKASDGTTVGEKLLSTLLTEIDGLELAKGVLVLAATNRPNAIDSALIRSGRFDLVLYVPPPDHDGRLEILQVHTRSMKLNDDVVLAEVASSTEFFTGAELAGLCREAAMCALRENISADSINKKHFEIARKYIKPLLTPLEIAGYASFGAKFPKTSR